MNTAAMTPDNVTVTFRRMDFGLDPEEIPRDWAGGDPAATHLFTALSLLFPEGEKFFIDSVRLFADHPDLSEETRGQIRDFIRQEAHHGHQHRQLNKLAGMTAGFDVDRAERLLGKALNVARKLPKKAQLAMTVSLEHFTAVLANQLLTKPEMTENLHPAVRELWLWHAVEETEHKAVAFDIYQEVGGKRWLLTSTMARFIIGFPISIMLFQIVLLVTDRRLNSWRGAKNSFLYFWGRDGFVRNAWPELKAFFRRDFHPWDVQNQHLIDEWVAAHPS